MVLTGKHWLEAGIGTRVWEVLGRRWLAPTVPARERARERIDRKEERREDQCRRQKRKRKGEEKKIYLDCLKKKKEDRQASGVSIELLALTRMSINRPTSSHFPPVFSAKWDLFDNAI